MATTRKQPALPDLGKTKARLERFHMEAMSFLDKGHGNAIVVEDFDDFASDEDKDVASGNVRTTQVKAKRRVDKEKARLERFHHEALSFLKKAYADERAVAVDGAHFPDPLMAGKERAAIRKGELKKFHEATMLFLEKAYEGDPSPQRKSRAKDTMEVTAYGRRRSSGAERDKHMLEGYYREAVSFLDKAYNNDQSVTVQEENIGAAGFVARDKARLQKYAAEAMSFLDRAYRDDKSLMIEDDTDEDDGDVHGPRIAADRAALERYDEEAGDFLERAYNDDRNVIVEDESDASGNEEELFGRRGSYAESQERNVAPDRGNGPFRGTAAGTKQEHNVEDEYVQTDDEFQDRDDRVMSQGDSPATGSEVHVLDGGANSDQNELELVNDLGDRSDDHTSDLWSDSDGDNVQKELLYDDQDDVSSLGDTADNRFRTGYSVFSKEDDPQVRKSATKPSSLKQESATSAREVARLSSPRTPLKPSPNRASDEGLLVDLLLEDNAGKTEWSEGPMITSFFKRVPHGTTIKIRPKDSLAEYLFADTPRADKNTAMAVNADSMISQAFEHGLDELSKQLVELEDEAEDPRIKQQAETLKAIHDAFIDDANESGKPPSGRDGSNAAYRRSVKKEYHRLKNERDALITALEDVLNERSKLAAQVSEMKMSLVRSSGGVESASVATDRNSNDDVNLALELQKARQEMSQVMKESEAAISVLESRLAEAEKMSGSSNDGDANESVVLKNLKEQLSTQTRLVETETRKLTEAAREAARKEEKLTALSDTLAKRDAELEYLRIQIQGAKLDSSSSTDVVGKQGLWSELIALRAALQNAENGRDRAEKKLKEATRGNPSEVHRGHLESPSKDELQELGKEMAEMKVKIQQEQARADEMFIRWEDSNLEKQKIETELAKLRQEVGVKNGIESGSPHHYSRDLLTKSGASSDGKWKSSRAAAYELTALKLENEALKKKADRLEQRQEQQRSDIPAEQESEVEHLRGKIRKLEIRANPNVTQTPREIELVETTRRLENEREEARLMEVELGKKLASAERNLRAMKAQISQSQAKHTYSSTSSDHVDEVEMLRAALRDVKANNENMKRRHDDLQKRAVQAEQNAAEVERNAQRTMQAARKAQNEAKAAIEKERKMREAIELEKKSLERESQAWSIYQAQKEKRKAEAFASKGSRSEGEGSGIKKGASPVLGKEGSAKRGHRMRLFRS
eukprot:Plantae.Rhodophyta-Hildenbrandia_rubra.ctg7465.p1 GENE.Plantae.Rhodophyta-Hildenbrandia_rubra.ctg7465~~Plantae.Rhodophyta-Hildenbrandia_rubra.ctg7465.p1  ORF type:complete len:1268 (+),score=308.76 Plantae.Rhodophyta-Hildenbrandia_rubra.ctg7465:185-3805(+)